MKYSLGIDLGTSYFKFGIYDENTNLKGLGRVAVGKNTGNSSLCELPVERFQKLLKTGIDQACQQAQITPSAINSMGYSSQANSFLLLDESFQPLTPLILWPDTRYPNIHPKVKQLWDQPEFLQTTAIGIELSAGFCIDKLAWLREEKPSRWLKVKHIMTISDYLTFLFTNQTVGDMGTASLLGLLDCKNAKWWNKAFEILDLDKSVFSKRCEVGTKIENAAGEFSRSIGLAKSAKFYIGSLDHHMAALGAGVGKISDMSISIGTVLACVNITKSYNPTAGVCISPWKDRKYCQLIFDGNGATSLEWYQQNFANDISLEKLVQMAEKINLPDGLIAKPQAFKYQNIEDAFINVEEKHTHGNFIYALMVSSAQTLVELINKISPDNKPKRILATGGGAKSQLWLDITSKITGLDITKSKYHEPATVGAIIK